MQWARNVDATRGVYARRLGPAKLAQLEDDRDDRGAKVFGAIGKYATFTPPAIPVGGFIGWWHFRATRDATYTGTLFDSAQAAGPTNRPVYSTLDNAGLYKVTVTWSDGATSVIHVNGLADGSEQHALLVFDAKAGTLTLYLNGDAAGNQITGLSATAKPWQGVATAWYLGVENNPGTGITANSSFKGAIDAIGFMSTAGVDITDEDLTGLIPRLSLLSVMRARTRIDWPNPADPGLLFHYGLDEDVTLTTVMYDSSDARRHGTYAGPPSNATRVAVRAMNGQYLGTTREATVNGLSDARVNIAIAGGEHFFEILRIGS